MAQSNWSAEDAGANASRKDTQAAQRQQARQQDNLARPKGAVGHAKRSIR